MLRSGYQSAIGNWQPAMHYVSQVGSLRRPFLMWAVLATGCLITIALILGAPLALQSGRPFLSLAIYRSFGYLCHQIPERSFFLAGHPFAVCSRCFGLYSGFATAALSYPLLRSLRSTAAPPRKWLFLAAAPMAIDFGIEFLGLGHNTHFSRFATGALLGLVAVFYVMPGLLDLSIRNWSNKPESRPVVAKSVAAELRTENLPAAPSDYGAPHRRI